MPRMLMFEDLIDHGVPFTRSHLARLEKEEKFPTRVQIGANRVGWIEEEVVAWVEQKIADRAAKAKGRGHCPAPG